MKILSNILKKQNAFRIISAIILCLFNVKTLTSQTNTNCLIGIPHKFEEIAISLGSGKKINWNNIEVLDTTLVSKKDKNSICLPKTFYILHNKDDNQKFWIAKLTSYIENSSVFCKDSCFGLVNLYQQFLTLNHDTSNAELYKNTTLEYWANYIIPMQECESGLTNRKFTSIQTYDGTGITIGHLQFASHVPNGDFVIFLKLLLERYPNTMSQYFPDLVLNEKNRICKMSGNQCDSLENDSTTSLLQKYFNPDPNKIDTIEIINFAKWVDLIQRNDTIRFALDTFGILLIKDSIVKISEYKEIKNYYFGETTKRILPDYICLLMSDLIHNQGKIKNVDGFTRILKNPNLNNLLKFQILNDCCSKATRKSTLFMYTMKLIKEGKLGKRYYDYNTDTLIEVDYENENPPLGIDKTDYEFNKEAIERIRN